MSIFSIVKKPSSNKAFAEFAKDFPELRIVFEHITTRDAVDFVRAGDDYLAATITPHHLLINRNAIFQGGIRPHHYCLPVAKREQHRQALLDTRPVAVKADFLPAPTAPRIAKMQRKRPAAVLEFTPLTAPSNFTPKHLSWPVTLPISNLL